MVATQLQLKWPNHSTHLLTGLKSLFENEQLVDCTLKCNNHILKVHRSVLAACSPYFERELENTPSLVIKDMQFNVLQALIEFMYYGETRITEENLTSLIEAAKLFEIKGLSEMDLFTPTENSIFSSAVSTNGNCLVQNGLAKVNDMIFDNDPQPLISSTCKMEPMKSLPTNTMCSEDSEDSNSTLMFESNDSSQQSHACRNFVVTPPQTESAQILLSLARSYNEKQHFHQTVSAVTPQMSDAPAVSEASSAVDNFLNEHHFVMNGLQTPSSDNTPLNDVIDQHLSAGGENSLPAVNNADNNLLYVKYGVPEKCNGDVSSSLPTFDGDNESLLAKLLTRSNKSTNGGSPYYGNYKNLYDGESTTTNQVHKNLNDAIDTTKLSNFELQPDAILDCPFLIETNEGYVDVSVDNMMNVFDNGEIFDPVSSSKAARVVPKEEVISSMQVAAAAENNIPSPVREIDELELLRIKQDTENELKDDPDAVVLCKVNENGQVEKYVLSSADIAALKTMNEQIKQQQQQRLHQQSFNEVINSSSSPHIQVESSTSPGNTSFIAQIFSAEDRVENAISKLPFKKTSGLISKKVNEVASTTTTSNERILEDASLAVDAHHHENMFEELDSQFNMDCSIENIQREYVAYEEASKNETQLEHNYYANALKDEDEECVVISDIGLRSMMLIEEPTNRNLNLVTLSNNNNNSNLNNNNNNNNNNSKRKNNVVNAVAATALNTFQIIGTQDVYLNGQTQHVGSELQPRRNGLVAKPTLNVKCDLITNNDALMSSVLNTVRTSTAFTAKPKPGVKAAVRNTNSLDAKRKAAQNSIDNATTLPLPFKKVKNCRSTPVAEKKPRRTYRRKSTSGADTRQENVKNGFHEVDEEEPENTRMVEEIIIEDIL